MTSDNTAAGYAAANVLLDAVVALDPSSPVPVAPVDLALQRLSEVGAFTVTLEDDGGDDVTVDVNLEPLLGGTLTAMGRLVTLLADSTDVSREEIVSDLRAWLADL